MNFCEYSKFGSDSSGCNFSLLQIVVHRRIWLAFRLDRSSPMCKRCFKLTSAPTSTKTYVRGLLSILNGLGEVFPVENSLQH